MRTLPATVAVRFDEAHPNQLWTSRTYSLALGWRHRLVYLQRRETSPG
jgi:hypothetical protein